MIKLEIMKKEAFRILFKVLLVSLILLFSLVCVALAAARLLMQTTPVAAISDLEVYDYDLDGVGEIAASGPDRRVYLYENNGSLAYTSNQLAGTVFRQLLSVAPQAGSPEGAILITDTRRAFFNLNARNAAPLWTNNVPAGWVYVAPADTGDLNGDGLYDFANGRYNSGRDQLRVHVVRVTNGTQIAETGNLTGNLDALILENLGNSLYDSIVFSSTSPRFYIYNYNPGTGGISQAASVALQNRYTFLVGVSDANGDGRKDIACATYIAGGNNGIDLRSGANGALLASLRVTGASTPVSLSAADFDADGVSEVVVGTGGSDAKIRVYKARNPISLLWESPTLEGNVYLRTGDFDYDGKADIVAGSGGNVRLITYKSGTFNITETTAAISGSIDNFEKFKTKQYNGGAAEDIVFANNTNSQMKAITFYTPPTPRIIVYNERLTNTEISAGVNYLLDKLYFTANYDGVLNSIRYSYSGNLNPVYLTLFKLYEDNGNRRFEPESDTLLASTTLQSGYVVFNPNLAFVSDTIHLLYLVCDVRDDVPSGYSFKLSINSPQDFYAQNFETTGTFPIETATFATVDKNTPIVYLQPSILVPDGNNGWYRSAISIALAMNKLGIIYYKWNGDAKFYVYNGQLVPPAGENTLYVYGVDLYGNRSTTKTLTVKVDLTPPETVRRVQAEQTGLGQVTLVWRPSLDKLPGSGLDKYEIYRNGVFLASVAANQTSYVDYDVKPLTSYKYKIRAVDKAGNASAFSEEVAVKTGPAPVQITGLNVIEEATSNVILWDPVTTGTAGFIDIYRSSPFAAKDFVKINGVPVEPAAGIYKDQSIVSSGLYYYKLRLYDRQGNLLTETTPVVARVFNIEEKLGTGGGILSGPSKTVKLEIPPGALLNETTLQVKSSALAAPSGTIALSSFFEFQPQGLIFSKPATLTLTFKTNKTLMKDLIRIGYYDGQAWSFLVPDFLDTSSGVTQLKIDHFSVFGVLYLGTGIDLDPPAIAAVRSASPSKVFVTFSEFLDTRSVVTANFLISETSVTTFYPYKDGKTVVVETRYMSPDRVYELYVSGIRDLAGNLIPEDGVSNYTTFTVEPSPHGRYLDDTNKCSLCHSVHYGKNEQLLLRRTATEVCYLCHDKDGTGSKYNTQSWFEDPGATSTHRTRFGIEGIFCTDCHTPHRDVAERPSLLKQFTSESTATTLPPERFCFHCHGASESTFPVYLTIKETSYTSGIHYEALPGPQSGNGITCLQCHLPHASVQPTLMRGGTEEFACIACHKNRGVSPESGISIDAPDVLTSLLTAPDATVGLAGFPSDRVIWYKHPVIEYSERHTLIELYDSTVAAQSQATTETRHAECEDCHNSHYARATIYRQPPLVPDSVRGAAGVKVLYPNQDTTPVFVWNSYGDGVTYEYEVCLRCHSSFAKAWFGEDLARLFSPYNTSYHPVISVGKNQTTAINNSLRGYSSQSQILCSDCHYAADPTYPRGPHGSIYPFILSANYRFELKPRSDIDDYNSNDFALCFKCHSEEPFKDSSGASRSDTNFRFHGYHLRALYNNPGRNTVIGGILTPGAGQGNAICRECHYNQHGSSNPRLVTFSPNVLPTGMRTEPVFVPKTSNSNGYCLLSCHGRNHGAGMSY